MSDNIAQVIDSVCDALVVCDIFESRVQAPHEGFYGILAGVHHTGDLTPVIERVGKFTDSEVVDLVVRRFGFRLGKFEIIQRYDEEARKPQVDHEESFFT